MKSTKNGDSPLHFAAWNKSSDALRTLASQSGVDVNLENNEGKTALDLARQGDNQASIDVLRDFSPEMSKSSSEARSIATTPSIK